MELADPIQKRVLVVFKLHKALRELKFYLFVIENLLADGCFI